MGYKNSKQSQSKVEQICQGFDWNRVSWRDKEYLTTMVNDTINAKSFKDTGISFDQTYPAADDFVLFNNKEAAEQYASEFYHSGMMSSHLLYSHPKGRKYWLVWSFSPKN